ncbi:ATPase H(+)-transporting accessory protein 2 isoform X1 [Neodiprion pinetum]|uniref:ATPase H(+)-transporting accessory protein 2 isoform X1 n=1 Tax=Neodiprion lecontei TaxID=441921 RepID=A0A6J0BXY0_NEOLC|nr:ATPase H(+)-transporting accessory protein 2 isoform X1 [Neodiprion lecontei]XP_046476808.1 ATPase H(+)-transporting accessory protein 2 isoform X1 [Neodiprion pinetum]
MFRQILCVAVTLAAVQAHGTFTIMHSPESVTFHGNEEVCQSLLPEIFSLTLGYTTKMRGSWDGMRITNIFDLPEAVVGVAIEGVTSIEPPRGKHYPLIEDESEETTWQALSGRLEERDNSETVVRINTADGVDALGRSALGELKLKPVNVASLKTLSLENESDRKFLEEIQLLDAFTNKVLSGITIDDKTDLYWFVVSALSPVIDSHRDKPAAVKEALAILNDALSRLSNAFVDAYKGKVIIAVFTNDASHVRHTRAAGDGVGSRVDNITAQSSHKTVESTTEGKINRSTTESYERKPRVLQIKSDTINASKEYDATYPVMFTIFLWFGVAFVFSLIAICITIADMDPGRDSIIYRMTSNRMKKDN